MKKVKLTAGTFEFDDQFLPIVTKAIKEMKTGTLLNSFDDCIIFMDSIEAIEDNSGAMIARKDIKWWKIWVNKICHLSSF